MTGHHIAERIADARRRFRCESHAELLGRAELRELLSSEVVAQVERELQRLTPDRRARDMEDVADQLRLLGPLTTAEAAERGGRPEWLDTLEKQRRAIRVRISGEERWAAIEDAARLRDAAARGAAAFASLAAPFGSGWLVRLTSVKRI